MSAQFSSCGVFEEQVTWVNPASRLTGAVVTSPEIIRSLNVCNVRALSNCSMSHIF